MTSEHPIHLRPISPTLGVEVLNLDARKPITDTTLATLSSALDRNHFLLLPNQQLDAESQIRFVERFGPALVEAENGRKHQFVSHTHEEGTLGDARFSFHSDHAFMPDPIDLISLYGLEIPENCVATEFANTQEAARTLPASLRNRVQNLLARHIIDPNHEPSVVAIEAGPYPDHLPHAYHPILSKNPRTGESILYVSEQQSDRVDAIDQDEGRAILEALFAHIYSPVFTYRHEWSEGDLVIWNNRALQHARGQLSSSSPRCLRRVSIGGTSVFEFFRANASEYGTGNGAAP